MSLFHLEMEYPDGALELGATVRATLKVAHDERFDRANAVRVKLRRWHDRNSEDDWSEEVLTLEKERLVAGTYSFTFTIPEDGPCSYQGRYVKISWELDATLDMPWALDTGVSLKFEVKPRGWLARRVRVAS